MKTDGKHDNSRVVQVTSYFTFPVVSFLPTSAGGEIELDFMFIQITQPSDTDRQATHRRDTGPTPITSEPKPQSPTTHDPSAPTPESPHGTTPPSQGELTPRTPCSSACVTGEEDSQWKNSHEPVTGAQRPSRGCVRGGF